LTLAWDGHDRGDAKVCDMKRTLSLGAAWTASAAAAIGLGFLAVSLVDASASPGSQPAAVPDDLPSISPTAAPTAAPGADDSTTGRFLEQLTAGGTVYAGCASGAPVLASAPAAGWWVDDSSSADEVEFQDGTRSIEVRVGCATGVPQFSVEGPRADDQRGGDPSVTPAAPTSAALPTDADHPAGDDSVGRVGGGHGSDDAVPSTTADDSGGHGADDPAGDDSGGRGGGHGSDD
jgi:hypothetical protein